MGHSVVSVKMTRAGSNDDVGVISARSECSGEQARLRFRHSTHISRAGLIDNLFARSKGSGKSAHLHRFVSLCNHPTGEKSWLLDFLVFLVLQSSRWGRELVS